MSQRSVLLSPDAAAQNRNCMTCDSVIKKRLELTA